MADLKAFAEHLQLSLKKNTVLNLLLQLLLLLLVLQLVLLLPLKKNLLSM